MKKLLRKFLHGNVFWGTLVEILIGWRSWTSILRWSHTLIEWLVLMWVWKLITCPWVWAWRIEVTNAAVQGLLIIKSSEWLIKVLLTWCCVELTLRWVTSCLSLLVVSAVSALVVAYVAGWRILTLVVFWAFLSILIHARWLVRIAARCLVIRAILLVVISVTLGTPIPKTAPRLTSLLIRFQRGSLPYLWLRNVFVVAILCLAIGHMYWASISCVGIVILPSWRIENLRILRLLIWFTISMGAIGFALVHIDHEHVLSNVCDRLGRYSPMPLCELARVLSIGAFLQFPLEAF